MATVTVALRYPNGLTLRLHKPVEVQVPVLGGGTRTETQWHPTGQTVRINGNAHPQDKAPKAQIVDGIDFGYALTPNVDKTFWDEWVKQNSEHPLLKNGLLFAHEKDANTIAEARDHKNTKSGLERLDPANLPKALKPSSVAAS